MSRQGTGTRFMASTGPGAPAVTFTSTDERGKVSTSLSLHVFAIEVEVTLLLLFKDITFTRGNYQEVLAESAGHKERAVPSVVGSCADKHRKSGLGIFRGPTPLRFYIVNNLPSGP